MSYVLDPYEIREIHPLNKRFNVIKEQYKNDDESVRWDQMYLAGELVDNVTQDFKDKIADWFVWVMQNDDNSVVRHEAAFQIGLRNLRKKIPDLIEAIIHDQSLLVKHEAIEALGLLRVPNIETLLAELSNNPHEAVSTTAKFVAKRIERLKGKVYRDGEPI